MIYNWKLIKIKLTALTPFQ